MAYRCARGVGTRALTAGIPGRPGCIPAQAEQRRHAAVPAGIQHLRGGELPADPVADGRAAEPAALPRPCAVELFHACRARTGCAAAPGGGAPDRHTLVHWAAADPGRLTPSPAGDRRALPLRPSPALYSRAAVPVADAGHEH